MTDYRWQHFRRKHFFSFGFKLVDEGVIRNASVSKAKRIALAAVQRNSDKGWHGTWMRYGNSFILWLSPYTRKEMIELEPM